jgi:3'-phosphoadenosine 5'-phosphosulfate sulfotransferase (PAPS reductase)/FAD synthetase
MSELRDMFDGCTVVASVSGGKDSAALCLWLQEQEIPHKRVFADTGWEAPWTYEYLRGPLTDKLGPIDEVRGARGMADLVRHKGMFPSRLRRFCTEHLKIRPLAQYMGEQPWPVVNVVGVRAAESRARACLPEWERAGPPMIVDTWRPLLTWSEQDVINIHARHGLAPNPLYLKGARRVGCWPCIYARKAEVRLVAELSPERIDEIEALEAEVGASARRRYAARGETLESRGYHEPTYFHTHNSTGGMIRIRDAVAWSRTAHGGKQLVLCDLDPPGCMRWGLCEAVQDVG